MCSELTFRGGIGDLRVVSQLKSVAAKQQLGQFPKSEQSWQVSSGEGTNRDCIRVEEVIRVGDDQFRAPRHLSRVI